MNHAIEISNALLWVAVVSMGVVIWALVRQIGVLHVRLAPVGALVTGNQLRAGDAAPVFNVADLGGTFIQIGGAQPGGVHTLLFFLSPTCQVCKTLLPAIKSIAQRERSWLQAVLASDGPRAPHEALVREHGLEKFPYLLSMELGMGFRVSQLPYAVLMDGEGVIRAQGLVNSREHLESLFEANERGVASLQEHFAKTYEREQGA